ncbi:MAG: TolC family protein [candidate division NC10 bacterium]|nr:TolC family protein [candidate division NC10 bacterium]
MPNLRIGGLSLGAAIRQALESHPGLRAAGHQVAAVATGIDQARAGFLPRVDFSEGVSRSDNPVYAFGSLLNQGRFTAADFAVDRLNHPDAITNWRTNLSGSLPLFMGGRTYLGYEQAQIGRQAAELGRGRLEQEVIFGVVRAYHAVLLAQEALGTVQTAVRTAEANLAAAEARYEAGIVVASDALAARVRLSRLQEESIAAANQVRLSQAALNEAMGLPLESPHRIRGQMELLPPTHDRLEGLAELARQHRPDYRQAALEEQRLEKEIAKAKGALLPTVHLMGNYEINNNRFAGDGQDNWSVGLLLNLNLFNGGGDRARIVEAQENYRRASALKERLGNAIGLEVHDAFLAHQTARQRVAVVRETVRHAEESLRIVKDRYEAGLTTIVELLDSETALTATRTNLIRALYEATVSEARLELSLGRLDRARF